MASRFIAIKRNAVSRILWTGIKYFTPHPQILFPRGFLKAHYILLLGYHPVDEKYYVEHSTQLLEGRTETEFKNTELITMINSSFITLTQRGEIMRTVYNSIF